MGHTHDFRRTMFFEEARTGTWVRKSNVQFPGFTASWPVGSGGHSLVGKNSDVDRKTIVAPVETRPFL